MVLDHSTFTLHIMHNFREYEQCLTKKNTKGIIKLGMGFKLLSSLKVCLKKYAMEEVKRAIDAKRLLDI